jgi:hypothetical protein
MLVPLFGSMAQAYGWHQACCMKQSWLPKVIVDG